MWLLFVMGVCMAKPIVSQAAVTVEPSGDEKGYEDYSNISDALKTDGDVILVSGATYYLNNTLYVESNQSITATGATIISDAGVFRNTATKTNYKSINHFTVNGGTWKNSSKNGWERTMIQFSHGKNITIKNATVYCNYKGHSIELIACKNVTVDNCTLIPQGKCDSDSVEEQLQIDIATPKTAPTIGGEGSKLVQGQTCQNITVKNCTITGGRGVCANFASTEDKYKGKFHKNIVLKNNKITGVSSEGVALFNVLGAVVENNVIISKSKRTNTAYSVGLHIAIFGKAPSSIKSCVYKVNNNTIKGGRQGFFVYSHAASKLGKVEAKGNKCYAKAGKEKALQVSSGSVIKTSLSKNKLYKWN
jgi:hypothetical protein